MSYSYNRFCSCGNVISSGQKCSCKKNKKTASQKNHIAGKSSYWPTRDLVRVRDLYCQRCAYFKNELVTEDKAKLHVHHIKSFDDFPELAYDENNLVLVCQPCNNDLGKKNKLDFPFEPKEMPRVL